MTKPLLNVSTQNLTNFSHDEVLDYTLAQGFGAPTASGYERAGELWLLGSDYAAIAAELAFLGLTEPAP